MTRSLLFVAMILVSVAKLTESNTKSDCGVAQTAFGMCVPYVMGLEPKLSPKCCTGAVRWSVKDLSKTPTARRSICECLRLMMAMVGKINQRRASGLPARQVQGQDRCHPYQSRISLLQDCVNLKLHAN